MTSFSEVIPGLVSTIIPVYNRPQMIRKAVESVLSQTYRPIEIIIVDDGSTDETPNVLDELKSAHPKEITIVHKENSGPGLAREAGRLKSKGEYIQYLDSDDWLLPEKFMIQVDALRAHPECGIAYGKSRFIDENGNILQEPSKWTGRRIDYLFPALLVDRWWHTHTPLYRRSVSDAAGAWPSRRPEDWDLESRMGALNVKLFYCDELVSCQVAHSGIGRVSQGPKEKYLIDEAWFLPRLYHCAIKSGVHKNTPEMKHFSHWAFFTARQLADIGKDRLSYEMVRLSAQSSDSFIWKTGALLYSCLSKIFGWKTMKFLSQKILHMLERKPPMNSMPGSRSK